MPWKPISESDTVVARQFKEVAAALIAARHALDPRDPKQGPVWTMIDRAEVTLQGLASIVASEEEVGG